MLTELLDAVPGIQTADQRTCSHQQWINLTPRTFKFSQGCLSLEFVSVEINTFKLHACWLVFLLRNKGCLAASPAASCLLIPLYTTGGDSESLSHKQDSSVALGCALSHGVSLSGAPHPALAAKMDSISCYCSVREQWYPAAISICQSLPKTFNCRSVLERNLTCK